MLSQQVSCYFAANLLSNEFGTNEDKVAIEHYSLAHHRPQFQSHLHSVLQSQPVESPQQIIRREQLLRAVVLPNGTFQLASVVQRVALHLSLQQPLHVQPFQRQPLVYYMVTSNADLAHGQFKSRTLQLQLA